MTLFSRLRIRARILRLNRKPGLQIHNSTYLGKGVLIQTASDGIFFGGQIVISPGVALSDGVILATYGGRIEIGANVFIGPYCVLYGHGGLTIGPNTMIGAHTVIVPANHGFERADVPMNVQPLTKKGIAIAENVWIGSGCKILDGSKIGPGSIIGAGSVVTKDIAASSVAFGVPAVTVRSRGAK